MKRRQLMLILGIALVAVLGYWLAGKGEAPETVRKPSPPVPVNPRWSSPVDDAMPKFRRGKRLPVSSRDHDAAAEGAIEGQRVLVFKDQDALARFLKKAGDRITVMGRLDALNALRVGFSNYSDLLALLDGKEEQSFIFPVRVPDLPEGSVQPGAVALGEGLLDWLGVTGDNSAWGRGVKIAILDTGVTANSAFNTLISSLNLIPLPSDPATQNGHGTAVASMIIGSDALTPGVAPGSPILSIRIADDAGNSDSFLLAQGIIAAVDNGSKLINISLGGFGDSPVMRKAIEYARSQGVMIFAPAGNNGIDQVAYPAAYEGVIAVGAVDALGNHLDFSNSGEKIDISAPGLGVNAAWVGDQPVSVTGTSFSSPIVAGVVAALMTQAGSGNLTANQAYNLLAAYLNDGGAAGKDPQLGAGMPDIGRALTGTTRGVYDAAVAAQRILPPDSGNPYGQVQILVQNRGTELLVNTAVRVTSAAGTNTVNLTTLAPDAVKTITVPITRPATAGSSGFTVDSRVTLSGGVTDVKPSNDRRVETYVPAAAK